MHNVNTGIRIHTKSIRRLNDLINPDGLSGSLVISPFIEILRNGQRENNNLIAGMNLEWIISNFITMNIEYTLNRNDNLNQSTILFGPNIHIQKPVTNRKLELNNPDGRPGLFTFSPHIGTIIYEKKDSILILGLLLKTPISQFFTFQLIINNLTEMGDRNNENFNQYSFGAIFYF